jgi:hypothetical protein
MMPSSFPRPLEGLLAGRHFGRILEMREGMFGPTTDEALSLEQHPQPTGSKAYPGLLGEIGAEAGRSAQAGSRGIHRGRGQER